MHHITGLVLAIIALVVSAAAPDVMAAPQSRYIDEQRLDTDTLRDVNTIALLEVTDPEAYYGGGKILGTATEFLGVIGMIYDIAEWGKDADQYAGTDFAQSLQVYLEQFLSENNYRIVETQRERGVVSNIDFIDAKLNLQNAKLQQITDHYNFITTIVEYYYLTGKIEQLL